MNEYINGELGWKGETGDSAYEIAVKHGYTGTEAQWSDDFLNAENYYDKTETDTLLGNYYTKTETDTLLGNYYNKSQSDSKYVANSNIVVLTGSMTADSSGEALAEISYPTGFTKSNTYIISAKHTFNGYTMGVPMTYVDTTNNTVSAVINYGLNDNNFYLYASGPLFNATSVIGYTVVLMKIS